MADESQVKRLKIMTWNINGIRAVTRENNLKAFLDELDVDIVCFQETKITRDMLEESICIVEGYNSYFSFSRVKTGYSGVATFCKDLAIPKSAEEGLTNTFTTEPTIGCYGNTDCFTADQLKRLDKEGRTVLTEYELDNKECLVIINTYCPRADPDNDKRMEFKMQYYKLLQIRVEALLESGKHVIVLGDLNLTHKPIDNCDPGDLKTFNSHPSRIWMNKFVKEISVQENIFHKRLNDQGKLVMPFDEKPVKQETFAVNIPENPVKQEKNFMLNNDNHVKQVKHALETEELLKQETIAASYTVKPELLVSLEGTLVDSFRYIYPTKREAYTNWCTSTGARQTNYGRRLDYILADILLIKQKFLDVEIRPEIEGSDHCPVVATLSGQIISSKRPPPLCSRFMPEFSGKQQKLGSYFQKKDATQPFQSLKNDIQKEELISTKRSNRFGGNPPSKRLKSQQNNIFQFFGKKTKNETTNVIEEGLVDSQNSEHPCSSTNSDSPNNSKNKLVYPNLSYEVLQSLPKTCKEHQNAEVSAWKSILKGPSPPPRCPGHNEPSVLRTVKKKGPNLGRQFYCCARPEGHSSNKEARCKFFKWMK